MEEIKKIIIISLLLGFCGFVHGQREAANWYFGKNAGLDFNSGNPMPLVDGQMNTIEGCETTSDFLGNLLFYSDGVTIWNRNHDVMANGQGLLGSISATQSALAVPRPGNSNIYYLFTSDAVQAYQDGSSGNGLNYSVIDMGDGLGNVVQKNIGLLPNASEKLTGIARQDGTGFWVLTHSGNRFYAFSVTSAGVNPTPVVSTLGPDIDDFNNIRGAMKVSPKGDKLAVAHSIFSPEFDGQLYLYDFNIDTGIVSNQLALGSGTVYYGVEFSSNGDMLYTSSKSVMEIENTVLTGDYSVSQFDLTVPNIPESEYVLETFAGISSSDLAGSLQIAMDKKIYHALPGRRISVIRTPNQVGSLADYRRNIIDLDEGISTFGLPPFIQSLFESVIEIEGFCAGTTTRFTIDSEESPISAQWDFGDSNSGQNNTSTLLNPSHVFSSPGIYTVTVMVDFLDRPQKQFFETVEITAAPVVNEDVVLTQCDVDGDEDGIATFNLDQVIPLITNPPGLFDATYHLTEEDALENRNGLEPTGFENDFSGQNIYARVFENTTCFTVVPFTLEVNISGLLEPIALEVCDVISGETLSGVSIDDLKMILEDELDGIGVDALFFATLEDALLYQNILTDIFNTSSSGNALVYYNLGGPGTCEGIGIINLDILDSPEEEDQEVSLCPGEDSVELGFTGAYSMYNWSTGESSSAVTVSTAGTYSVVITNSAGCGQEVVFNVTVPAQTDIYIGIEDFRQNNSISFFGGVEGTTMYSIDGGMNFQAVPVFQNLSPGIYELIATDGSCSEFRETVVIRGVPNYFTPNQDGFHDTWHVSNVSDYPGLIIYIFDRYGKLLKTLTANSPGWDGTFNGKSMPSTDYWYVLNYDGLTAKGHFSLKR